MASIIDSFRETFTDNLSFFKILVFAIPVYYSYDLYLKSTKDFTGFTLLASITIFLLFGFLIKTTSNVLNEGNSVLPSLNPIPLVIAAIKGILAIGPLTFISVLLGNYFASLINIILWLDVTLKTIIWLLVASISMTAFLMFVKREKIVDAYDFKILSAKAGDFMISLIFFIIQMVIMNTIIFGFIGYTIIVLFGVGPILYFILSMAVVYNVGVMGHYMAQLQYELLSYDKDGY